MLDLALFPSRNNASESLARSRAGGRMDPTLLSLSLTTSTESLHLSSMEPRSGKMCALSTTMEHSSQLQEPSSATWTLWRLHATMSHKRSIGDQTTCYYHTINSRLPDWLLEVRFFPLKQVYINCILLLYTLCLLAVLYNICKFSILFIYLHGVLGFWGFGVLGLGFRV